MAARNIKNQGAGHFDTADKLQSNTLKVNNYRTYKIYRMIKEYNELCI